MSEGACIFPRQRTALPLLVKGVYQLVACGRAQASLLIEHQSNAGRLQGKAASLFQVGWYLFKSPVWIYNFPMISTSEPMMQIGKWGNSLAVRLPGTLVQELGIAEGDEIELVPVAAQIKMPMTFTVKRAPSKLDRLHAMRRYRSSFPREFKFDRDEANAR
jgi:antitoxin MazE